VIRRDRGPEPPQLAAVRSRALPALRSIRATRPIASDDFRPYDYRVAFRPLYERQHGICCFCECREQPRKNPVEHLRPKTQVDHEQGAGAVEGYWWLAYSWENLAFACQTCNEKPFKGIRFPLAPASARLVAEESPPGPEQPLLLDPFSEDPGRWIEFVFDRLGGGWMPQARSGVPKERGEATIRVLGLYRQDLRDHRDWYVRHTVEPAARRIQSVLASGDAAAVVKVWGDELSHLFDPGAPFQALSRDVLCHHIPADERARFGLGFPGHVALS